MLEILLIQSLHQRNQIAIPRLLFKGRYLAFIGSLILWLVAGWYLSVYYLKYISMPALDSLQVEHGDNYAWQCFLCVITASASFCSLSLGKQWLLKQKEFLMQQKISTETKTSMIAELKTVRAIAYYMMMDLYGNVPLDTLYGATDLKSNAPRAKVFSYVESELKAAIPYLKTTTGTATYGLPTKYLAYSILAKMYLNAAVYTGTPRYDDCIAACDQIVNSGLYSIEPMSTYLQMFYPTNGPSQKEFIFAIPFDASTSSGTMAHARYDLNRNLGIRYLYSGSTPGAFTNPVMNQNTGSGLVNNKPSGPRMTTSEFYTNFNDPNDIRNKQWLTGLQTWQDGSPVMVSTTNLGYDQFYAGSTPAGVLTYQLNLTPLTSSRLGASAYDLGKDEIAWNTGYRNIKFLADYTNPINRNQNNDMPVFRYSDIVLMKAEAIFRGGTATLGATALSLVNSVRSNRTTSPALSAITLDVLYNERCKEFTWETWHRNDMIRFGKFEASYGLSKTNADTYRRIFPIPSTAIATNNTLVQNPGY
ncbi:MAG: RagB/SusD family nutrient uptake outer membrane protein [Pedobacter sp.]|nr:MAG: RagB/SusD family nutrient uptake outer membrane protein [Pedobacter sp.]